MTAHPAAQAATRAVALSPSARARGLELIELLEEVDFRAPVAGKTARNCAKMRKMPASERRISVISQGVMGGVKLPLSPRKRRFDTDTSEAELEEHAADMFGAAMVLAYDTEWQSVDGPEGVENDILSYQVVARSPDATCELVIYADGARLELGELIDITRKHLGIRPVALRKGEVIIAAHFGAAEWSALADRDRLAEILNLVRKAPVTLGAQPYDVRLNNRPATLRLRVVDTFLLAPDGNKSLAALGRVVGLDKVELPPGAISQMRGLMDSDPGLFELYGIQDARVTLMYLDQIADVARRELGVEKLPLTVGGLSVTAFVDSLGDEYMRTFGLEKVRQYRRTVVRPVEAREHSEAFFSLGFAGGLNNATPGVVAPEDGRVVFDIDFVSAYPAAMASVPMIDWSGSGENGIETGIYPAGDGKVAAALSLSFVEFEFPGDCNRPCIPVDAGARGIIYPLRGRGYATAAEMALARTKGARMIIREQKRMPVVTDDDGNARLAFADYLAHVIARRRDFQKGTLENLLYKLLCNALYGKLAQGVKRRTVRSFGNRGELPQSKVTCPAYACAVTGAVRAALIALQDAVEECGGRVHSATTDGCTVSFPGSPETHPDLDSIPGLKAAIMRKPAVKAMSQGLVNMGLPADPLELKAVGDSCEVWKTRGYVIRRGDDVLHVGRAGHQLSAEELHEHAASDEIGRWELKSLASAQSIYDGKNKDLVELRSTRRVNLDYDFKLIPTGRGGYRPPRDLEEFEEWREAADGARRQGIRATETRVALSVASVQLRGGEVATVRRQLLRALLQDVGGSRPEGLTDREVAERLGLNATDAKNAKRRAFKPLPDTPAIRKIMDELMLESGLHLTQSMPSLIDKCG